MPDLVISDYRLSDGQNGIEAIETLRAAFDFSIPAFLISGDTAARRVREARERLPSVALAGASAGIASHAGPVLEAARPRPCRRCSWADSYMLAEINVSSVFPIGLPRSSALGLSLF
jgi:CheY-like chemotaxis protein